MADNVAWVVELGIKDGQLDSFKSLMNEMVQATQDNEPGAMNYEWFLSEDGQNCHIYERYVDSAAAMTHLQAFGQKFADRFLAAANPERFVVYGNPDSAVREALAGFGAIHLGPIGGFAR